MASSKPASSWSLKKYKLEAICGMSCLALGMISGYLAKYTGQSLWYESLYKPSFHPHSWIFGPIWTVLYIMMGIAFGKLLKDKKRDSHLITLFVTQLILNLAWSPLLFYYQRIDLALIDICMLWISLFYFMIGTIRRYTIYLLFLPYMLWVSFAAVVSYQVYQLNTL